ncbi:MAG: tetratricopeptide repeat protein [Burkholderiaceae bacterium]|nr:tetratricopeptide repeat protein [Roseateles sp.]MBV8469083.1 tetratricopeptide repeat protein [Burkholderiaceae bacterium]
MPQFLRRQGVSAESRQSFGPSRITVLLGAVLGLAAPLALAQAPAASTPAAAPAAPASAASAPGKAAPAPVVNSDLDAPLFYQLLVGELELRTGQAGVAYQVLLDAARRTQDEALFKRAIGIALQGHAGEQALTAAKAWREAEPRSLEANQTVIQLLAALNRPQDMGEPLQSLLALTPEAQRPGIIAALPTLFSHSPDQAKVLDDLKPALNKSATDRTLRLIVLVTEGRLAIAAGKPAQALAFATQAHQEFPQAPDPLVLALDLMGEQADAEKMVLQALADKPDDQGLRLAYARALARTQRPVDAAREFRLLTQQLPDNPTPWFALGSLEFELHHNKEAETALQTFLETLKQAAGQEGQTLSDSGRDAKDQALLLLSQSCEARGDYKAAQAWLDQVDGSVKPVELQFRRASLLAHQGKLNEGRRLLQNLPGERDEDIRTRSLAESQLLREANQWRGAYEVLEKANDKVSDDPDMLYEQAMVAERLDRMDDMERILRHVIELKPKYYNAYNALGYSFADRNVRLEEARELIEKALSYSPSEPFIIDSLGWVEFRLGHLGNAEKLLRQAYVARPDGEIAAHLGEVLWTANQHDEARKVLGEALEREPDNESLRSTLKRLGIKP